MYIYYKYHKCIYVYIHSYLISIKLSFAISKYSPRNGKKNFFIKIVLIFRLFEFHPFPQFANLYNSKLFN